MKNNHTVKFQLTDGDISTENDPSYYSTLHWITSLSEMKDITNDDGVRKIVFWFLQNHSSDWVEDLVLREQLSAVAAKLEGLDLSLQRRAVSFATASI